jgi:hypothetical protein
LRVLSSHELRPNLASSRLHGGSLLSEV